MTQREKAARQLCELLRLDLVGDLVDAIGDANLRDGLLKVAAMSGAVVADEEHARAIGEREQQRVHGQAQKHVAPPPGARR